MRTHPPFCKCARCMAFYERPLRRMATQWRTMRRQVEDDLARDEELHRELDRDAAEDGQ